MCSDRCRRVQREAPLHDLGIRCEEPSTGRALLVVPARSKSAAGNGRHGLAAALPSEVGGGADERTDESEGPGNLRTAAPEPGDGHLAAVRRGRLLPGPRQGPGQVRDAPGARGRGPERERHSGGSRLFTFGVLPGKGVLHTSRHDGSAGRAARTARPGQGHRGHRAFIQAAPAGLSSAVLADEVERIFGELLHRRTVERIRRP